MGFVKSETDGYILGVAQVSGNGNISESEYNAITETIRNMPTAPDGYQYHLTTGLEWELSEIPTIDETETLSETEQKAFAYDILMGVSE